MLPFDTRLMFQKLCYLLNTGLDGERNLNIVTPVLQRWTGTVRKGKRGWEMGQEEMTWEL